jgi:hypothetical protein
MPTSAFSQPTLGGSGGLRPTPAINPMLGNLMFRLVLHRLKTNVVHPSKSNLTDPGSSL